MELHIRNPRQRQMRDFDVANILLKFNPCSTVPLMAFEV